MLQNMDGTSSGSICMISHSIVSVGIFVIYEPLSVASCYVIGFHIPSLVAKSQKAYRNPEPD